MTATLPTPPTRPTPNATPNRVATLTARREVLAGELRALLLTWREMALPSELRSTIAKEVMRRRNLLSDLDAELGAARSETE